MLYSLTSCLQHFNPLGMPGLRKWQGLGASLGISRAYSQFDLQHSTDMYFIQRKPRPPFSATYFWSHRTADSGYSSQSYSIWKPCHRGFVCERTCSCQNHRYWSWWVSPCSKYALETPHALYDSPLAKSFTGEVKEMFENMWSLPRVIRQIVRGLTL